MQALWRIAVRVRGVRAAGEVAELLDELAGGVSAFETKPGEPNAAEWTIETYSRVSLLDAALEIKLALATAAAGGAVVDIVESRLPERDWLAENRRAFPPQSIGRFLVRGSHWRESAPAGAIVLEIDAASAFGTGEHSSTRGCLLALDRLAWRRRFRYPRDIGTGSGILAIAAAKLLHRPVAASDVDPVAVQVARHHVRHNGLARLVRVECAAGIARRGAGCDLVFANILARPLALMARDLARAIRPGGVAVLSGLLRRQEAGVLAAYRPQGLTLDFRLVIEGWSTLVLRKGRQTTAAATTARPPGGSGAV